MRPVIKAYHAHVLVKGKDGRINELLVDLPDFASTDEVLSILGAAFDVDTAGEIVTAVNDLQRKKKVASFVNKNDDILDIEVAKPVSMPDDLPVIDWNHKIDGQ